MRVRSSYSSTHETLSIRVSDVPIEGHIDSGGIPDLCGVRFLFDPEELGGLIGLMAESPFVGRTPEWRSKLSRILGPVLETAEEAWIHNEDSDVTFDVWEPEIGPQRALWAVVHNHIRVSFGQPPIRPLSSTGILRNLKAALAGLSVSLMGHPVLVARGSTEPEAVSERMAFFVDSNLAAAAGLTDEIAIECAADGCWLSFDIVEPSVERRVTITVGQEVIELAGRRGGRHRIRLSNKSSRGDLDVQLAFPPEHVQPGEDQ